MARVQLHRLTKVYDEGVHAVRSLDLEVGDGELLVLTGPSGAGKSATLRLIAGLERATSGRVRIAGRDVTDLPPHERDVVLVDPGPPERHDGTAAQELAGAAGEASDAEAEPRSEAMAGRVGLGDLLHRLSSTLSRGEWQRLALGAALLRRPAVLLLDDPLSALDPEGRARLGAELRALRGAPGAATVYVTPHYAEAMALADRVAVMERGSLRQVAPPLEVYERPATLGVAGFFGSPAMNLFPGALVVVENGVRFRGASLTLAVAPLDPPSDQVVLGVRPEHILLVGVKPDRVGSPDALASVQAVRPLGPHTLVRCRTDQGEEVALRMPERPEVREEQLVGLRIDRGHLHLFDRDTGVRISQPPAVGERWWQG